MYKKLTLIVALLISTFSFAYTEKELKEIEINAKEGVAEDQLKLAEHYYSNREVFNLLEGIGGGNIAQAMKWAKRAAYQGLPKAQIFLGDRFQEDYSELGKQEAIYWYTQAANQNYAYAFYKLGYLYEQLSLKEVAIQWYKKYVDYCYNVEKLKEKSIIRSIKQLGEDYTPSENPYWNEPGYESKYIIKDTDSNEDQSVEVAIYDQYIIVDGVRYNYQKTMYAYKLYSEQKGLFDFSDSKVFLVGNNHKMIKQEIKSKFLFAEIVWTDMIDTNENLQIDAPLSVFPPKDIRYDSSYRDLVFLKTASAVSSDPNGIEISVGIYCLKLYPEIVMFSYLTSDELTLDNGYRVIKEENFIKGKDYKNRGVSTNVFVDMYFNL